ncbi:hypothetical protein C5E10_09315 [Pseudoclavibacter sp. RFBG4]|nr:hypothetical protein C5E10_09315 [Pseudoclavibacter sp. RFBG4]
MIPQVPVRGPEADDACAPVQRGHDEGEDERHCAEIRKADGGDETGRADDDDEEQRGDGGPGPGRHALDRDDGRDVDGHGDDDEARERGAGAHRRDEEALPAR